MAAEEAADAAAEKQEALKRSNEIVKLITHTCERYFPCNCNDDSDSDSDNNSTVVVVGGGDNDSFMNRGVFPASDNFIL